MIKKLKHNRLFLLFLVIIVLYILSFRYIPMQSFPDWLYESWLFSNMLHGKISLSLNSYSTPNITTTLILGGLCYCLSTFIAAKCFLLIMCTLLYTGILAFFRQSCPNESDMEIFIPIAFLMTFNFNFFHGDVSFVLGLGLCFHAIAIVSKKVPSTIMLGLINLIIYYTHFISCFLFVFTTLAHLTWKKDLQNIKKFIASLIPIILLFIHYCYTKPASTSGEPAGTFLHDLYIKIGVIFFYLKPFPTFRDIWPETFWIKGLNIGVFLGYILIGIYAIKVAKSTFKKDERICVILSFILLYFLLPLNLQSVLRPGERLLILIFCYVTTLGIPILRKIKLLVPWLVGLSFFMIIIPTYKYNQAMQKNNPLRPYVKSAHNPFTGREYFSSIENRDVHNILPHYGTGLLSK